MKNKIKSGFLTLIMLFTTLYPSGQAFANGLPPVGMTLVEKQVFAEELANDDDFVDFFSKLTIAQIRFYANINNFPNDVKYKFVKETHNLLELEYEDLKIESKNKLIRNLTFKSISEFENFQNGLNEKLYRIIYNHPKLLDLDKFNLQEIFKLAIDDPKFKTKLSEKFECESLCWKALFRCNGLVISQNAVVTLVAFLGCVSVSARINYLNDPILSVKEKRAATQKFCMLPILGFFGLIETSSYLTCQSLFTSCDAACQ
ncbi:hypothetical protein [Flavobacterium sp. XS2P14]|uniref:hypothetical protein n=1 Tax=Flavobacterium sp. XS2P14 TaxID=3401735 RepID=UPI003AAF6C84